MEKEFIKFMIKNRLSENTYKSYANDLKIFKDYYFNTYGENLTTLNHADISMYINYLRKHDISVKSINRKIAALKQYNLFLLEQNLQTDIVILDKDYIKIQPSMIKKHVPALSEINKLKHTASRDDKNAKRDYCLICIFLYGGLRESELVNIKINDIKLEEHFINIIGKGNKFRQVIINSYMYDAIKDYLEERLKINTENPYLFIGQKNKFTKEPLNRNFCNRLLNKYGDLCKIAKLHPHLLRAYFCTNALHNAGYSLDQVANQAGHSSINTTKLYLDTEKEDLVSLANKL